MRPTPEPALEVPSEDWAACEPVLARFEAAWRHGPRPALDDYLPPPGERHAALLLELVHTDLEFRLKAGEAVRAEEYLGRYPELAGAGLAGLLVAQSRLRQHAAEAPPVPPPGSRLGKYELLEAVGQGSFGVVYRARDAELDRTVAVKLPRGGRLATAEDEERFLREARSAARLRHPNLVALYDAGRIDGACFLASEFVDGPTLARRLAAGRPTCPEAAALAAQVADALHHAHQNGVVHRDLKPANILLSGVTSQESGASKTAFLTPDSCPLTPKIADFGLAKRDAGEATLTQEGEVLGTPAYMAPEQARGDARRVDARSDVYSLGVILYEMLTGEVPFRGTGRMVLLQVLDEEPRPPRRLNEAVPADLETVCLKALAKDPARRYPTAADFAEDLRRFLRGESVRARPVGAAGRLARWCRRRPVVAGLSAALGLALVAGVAGVFWQWRRAEAHLVEARHHHEKAEQNLKLAQQAVKDFIEIGRRTEQEAVSGSRLRRYMSEAALEHFQQFVRLSDDLSLQADLARAYDRMAGRAREIGDGPGGLAASQKALAIWENLVRNAPSAAQFRRGLALCHDGIVTTRLRTGELAEARPSLEVARALWEELVRQEPAEVDRQQRLAQCYKRMGTLHRRTGQLADALVWLRKAQGVQDALAGRLPDVESRVTAMTFTLRETGQVHEQMGRPAEAIPLYLKSLRIEEQLPPKKRRTGQYQLSLADSWHIIGRAYVDLGQPAEAVAFYEKSVALKEGLCHEDPDNLLIRSGLCGTLRRFGLALAALGRRTEALAAFQRSIERRLEVLRDKPDRHNDRTDLAETYHQRGQHLEAAGRREEALAAYEQAVHHQRLALTGAAKPEGQTQLQVYSAARDRLHSPMAVGDGAR